jgi:3-oxoacyl-[acyl-carrier protein] reductase
VRLAGASALVTGGGRGIGRSIAIALAAEGAGVVLCARTSSEVEAVAVEIRRSGGQAWGVVADVTSATSVARLMAQTRLHVGDIDILINNAGGTWSALCDASGAFAMAPDTRLWDWPEAAWDRLIDTHLKSVFLCTKAVIPQMIARGRGDIVSIASMMGRGPVHAGGAYAIAKTAVIALTEFFAAELVTFGVRVNAVSPGMTATPGNTILLEALKPGQPLPDREPAETVAKAVLYLLCDAPKSMTGKSLDIYGIK